jgi:hypothetical protein
MSPRLRIKRRLLPALTLGCRLWSFLQEDSQLERVHFDTFTRQYVGYTLLTVFRVCAQNLLNLSGNAIIDGAPSGHLLLILPQAGEKDSQMRDSVE